MPSTATKPTGYMFAHHQSGTSMLGLSVAQLVIGGTWLAVFLVAIVAGGGQGFVFGVLVGIPTAAVMFLRVGYRPVHEWIPVGIGWLGARNTWVARMPLVIHDDNTGLEDTDKPRGGAPPVLAGIDVITGDDGEPAVIRDRGRNELIALLRVHGQHFDLLDEPERVQAIAGWGAALAQTCSEASAISRITWSQWTASEPLQAHRDYVSRYSSLEDNEFGVLYGSLLEVAGGVLGEHTTVVAVHLNLARVPRRKAMEDPLTHGRNHLLALTRTFAGRLSGQGLLVTGPLTHAELAQHLRARVNPDDRSPNVVDLTAAAPVATRTEWDHFRTERTLHRSFVVTGWPPMRVPTTWLLALLAISTPGAVAITMTHDPVSPRESTRRINQDLARLASSASQKEKLGQRVGREHAAATQAVHDREEQLVHGHGEVRYGAVITVTASDEAELDEACDLVVQTAQGECQLTVRATDGQHDLAWAASTALGNGLRWETTT